MNTNLEKYMELILIRGINFKENDYVIVRADKCMAEFTNEFISYCYKKKAKKVFLFETDLLADAKWLIDASISDINERKLSYNLEIYEIMKEYKASCITFVGTSPYIFDNVTSTKKNLYLERSSLNKNLIREARFSFGCKTTIVGVANESWASVIYPDDNPIEAKNKLWEAIFRVTYTTADDPILAWEKHMLDLQKRRQKLNALNLVKLYYKDDKTDCSFVLHAGCGFGGGLADGCDVKETNNPNIPTEEIYHTPYKYGVNGTIYASLPLNHNGNLIKDFYFTFENGKIVSFDAKEGKEVLEGLLNSSPNARYLGEIALVPLDSPIYKEGIIFYNTLFDENACSHLAFGMAFKENVKHSSGMTSEELDQFGINQASIHIDFMVGSDKLSIIGEDKEHNKYPILINGKWAF